MKLTYEYVPQRKVNDSGYGYNDFIAVVWIAEENYGHMPAIEPSPRVETIMPTMSSLIVCVDEINGLRYHKPGIDS